MTAPKRRWFRFAFSLRTLFVVVTFCALGSGIAVPVVRYFEWRQAHRYDELIRLITETVTPTTGILIDANQPASIECLAEQGDAPPATH
jgi:hypothetical protein